MKPSEIERQIASYTSKSTGRTLVGRMELYKCDGEPDQWRLIYNTNPIGKLYLQEDVLFPFAVHEEIRNLDGKLVLERD